jgi:heat shock protein HslJ
MMEQETIFMQNLEDVQRFDIMDDQLQINGGETLTFVRVE